MVKINILFIVLLFVACIGNSNSLESQEYVDKETKELKFKPNTKVFVIKNIFGDVNVEGTNSSVGRLEAKKKIRTDSKDELEQAKHQINVRVEEFGDTMVVYISAPFIEFRRKGNNFDYKMDNYHPDYEFRFDLSVKIPKNVQVVAGTINDGDLYVNNIEGKLKAYNVNGSIKLEKVAQLVKAFTVNGEIDVDFSKNPINNCKFKTINGDINVLCYKGLSAYVNYSSMNGEFYTNYDIAAVESEPMKVEKIKENRKFYKLGNLQQFKIGHGGIKMSFEALNGDMIVKYK